MKEYTIYSEFDLQKHKQTFINYLEVIIHEDGSVHYAVPSHQEYLIKYACKQLNCSRDELYDMCPEEYYFNLMEWLCKITKCVSVWSQGFIYCELSDNQKETLQILIDNGLTLGNIK